MDIEHNEGAGATAPAPTPRCPITGYGCLTSYVSNRCRCDACVAWYRAYSRHRYNTNEPVRARALAYKRRTWRLRQYGVTDEQFARQLEFQAYRCANPECGSAVDLGSPLDHEHKTGLKRGILCPPCNKMEGFLAKHAKRLRGLLMYTRSGGVWNE